MRDLKFVFSKKATKIDQASLDLYYYMMTKNIASLKKLALVYHKMDMWIMYLLHYKFPKLVDTQPGIKINLLIFIRFIWVQYFGEMNNRACPLVMTVFFLSE